MPLNGEQRDVGRGAQRCCKQVFAKQVLELGRCPFRTRPGIRSAV